MTATFGEIAIRKGLASAEQVEECLKIQSALEDMGIKKTLGAVMHDKKYLSLLEVNEVVRELSGVGILTALPGYEILAKLGEGTNGAVYRARHAGLGQVVALKILPPSLARDEDNLKRFNREARIATQLRHPNIVRALGVGSALGYHYFAMEYVNGPSAKTLLDRKGPLDEGLVLSTAAGIADALAYGWQKGIVHRDVKPGNILIAPDGTARLCDLGLAKPAIGDNSLTGSGVIVGTPFYISPEQVRCEVLDGRADLYSLGATMFHLIAGAPPFTGDTPVEIMSQHLDRMAPGLRLRAPHATPATGLLIRRLMSKRREDRPADAAAAAREIRAILAGPAPASPPR